MDTVGAPKKYSKKGLRTAVERYFDSITREVKLTEKVPTGTYDEKGHMIYEDRPVMNRLGEEVIVTEYLIPPSEGGLSAFLGIHRSTWWNYCDNDKHPEFFDTTSYARGRIHAYLEQESLTRQGKDLKGVLFNLENNFGYRESQSIELTGGALEQYLRELAEKGAGGQEF